MKTFESIVEKPQDISVDTLVHFCFAEKKPGGTFLKSFDKATGGQVNAVYNSGEFSGEKNTSAVFRAPAKWGARNILLSGLGAKSSATSDSFRQSAGTISRVKLVEKSETVAFDWQPTPDSASATATVEGYQLGSWKMLDYKTGEARQEPLDQTVYLTSASKATAARLAKALERGEIIAQAVALCRNLAFQPSNVLTPHILGEEAKRLGKQCGFKVRVLDEKQIAKQKMGALLAVNQGGGAPARFIIMEYNGGRKGQKPVVLVGKGVTFDTGGISLKPGLNMHEMKGDMTGSAVVISTMAAIARLGLKLNVIGLVPTTENVPSATAYKPGDIVIARNGKTIEIINTDAEGRLILADALDFANTFKPQAVIDIATLTGATLFILGYAGSPIMGNNKATLDRLRAASTATAEKVWEIPLWPEFTEQMRSKIADLVNSGGRPAGTAAAGAFLQEFIGDYPWAHIDIAYVDLEPVGQPYIPKGPSGFGVRLLIETLSRWKKL